MNGLCYVMIVGKMLDDTTVKQCHVVVALARLLARRDSELASTYEFSAADLADA